MSAPLTLLRSQPVSLTGQTTTTGQAARRLQRTFPRFSLLLFVLAMILSAPGTSWAADTAEAITKRNQPLKEPVIAAYLLNFVKYIDWPKTIPPPGEPWRIGILNNERVRDAFNPLVKGRLVNGRPIVVVHSDDATDLSNCQIVLLPSSGTAAAAKNFAERPVLTVIYSEKGTSEGAAAIELLLQKQNIRYLLNEVLLAAQGLKATPGLLDNSLRKPTQQPARSL